MNVEDLLKLDNKGVHNFSFGCLDGYFHLNQSIVKREIDLINGRILHLFRAKKVYVFSYSPDDLSILKELQHTTNIYSLDEVVGLEKSSKFNELAYNLEKVFDPASYPNSKKRHSRIKYPFVWLQTNGVGIRQLQDINEVEAFHAKWVEHKLADEKTFRMMFPTARYINCFKKTLVRDPALPVNYAAWGFYYKNKLALVRIVSIQGDYAYDLANFGNTWDGPSQLTNYADIWVLRELYTINKIRVFNCGAILNKNLKMFKSHYPNYPIISYGYGKIEKKKEKVNGLF